MTTRAFPPAHPTATDVLHEAPAIRRAALRRGVPARDVDDVIQEVVLAALVAISQNVFRPDPRIPPRVALLSWLRGITWRCSVRLMSLARVRLEVITKSGRLPELQGEISARDDPALLILSLLRKLKPERRAVLERVALGDGMPEIARELGIPVATGWTRLRLGRRDLLAALRRATARRW